MKICQENPNLVKNIRHSTWKCVLHCWQQYKITIKSISSGQMVFNC